MWGRSSSYNQDDDTLSSLAFRVTFQAETIQLHLDRRASVRRREYIPFLERGVCRRWKETAQLRSTEAANVWSED